MGVCTLHNYINNVTSRQLFSKPFACLLKRSLVQNTYSQHISPLVPPPVAVVITTPHHTTAYTKPHKTSPDPPPKKAHSFHLAVNVEKYYCDWHYYCYCYCYYYHFGHGCLGGRMRRVGVGLTKVEVNSTMRTTRRMVMMMMMVVVMKKRY